MHWNVCWVFCIRFNWSAFNVFLTLLKISTLIQQQAVCLSLSRSVKIITEFKKTATATATETSLNKRFNEKNNSCVRALYIFVHFFTVLCKTTTWNDQFCVDWRTCTTTAIFLRFLFKFIAVSQIQFRHSFDSDKQSKWLKSIPWFVCEI